MLPGDEVVAVYVGRRQPDLRAPAVTDKDVYRDAYDCWAGGVVAATRTPPTVPGVKLFEAPPVRCHNFTHEVRWDGPIVHQPEEIVDGRWMSLEAVRNWAEDATGPLVPDGRVAMLEWIRRFG